VGTRQALTQIAEISRAGLSTNAGKGILPESHPLSLAARSCKPRASRPCRRRRGVAGGLAISMGDSFLPKLDIPGAIIRIDI